MFAISSPKMEGVKSMANMTELTDEMSHCRNMG